MEHYSLKDAAKSHQYLNVLQQLIGQSYQQQQEAPVQALPQEHPFLEEPDLHAPSPPKEESPSKGPVEDDKRGEEVVDLEEKIEEEEVEQVEVKRVEEKEEAEADEKEEAEKEEKEEKEDKGEKGDELPSPENKVDSEEEK